MTKKLYDEIDKEYALSSEGIDKDSVVLITKSDWARDGWSVIETKENADEIRKMTEAGGTFYESLEDMYFQIPAIDRAFDRGFGWSCCIIGGLMVAGGAILTYLGFQKLRKKVL